jgi:hypothetical protein
MKKCSGIIIADIIKNDKYEDIEIICSSAEDWLNGEEITVIEDLIKENIEKYKNKQVAFVFLAESFACNCPLDPVEYDTNFYIVDEYIIEYDISKKYDEDIY